MILFLGISSGNLSPGFSPAYSNSSWLFWLSWELLPSFPNPGAIPIPIPNHLLNISPGISSNFKSQEHQEHAGAYLDGGRSPPRPSAGYRPLMIVDVLLNIFSMNIVRL